jgi:hypothetical protein
VVENGVTEMEIDDDKQLNKKELIKERRIKRLVIMQRWIEVILLLFTEPGLMPSFNGFECVVVG